MREHGFRRVHTRAALTAMLSGFGAVWWPLLLISGHRASLPWLIAAVLVAGGAGAVAVNATVVWVLVRTRPQPVAPTARGSGPSAVSLTRLILLPGTTVIAVLHRRVRRPTGSGAQQPGGERGC
ncbi:hypothetical protein [Pseudonocardia sp. GCM10023141]|uniref:hypothetical protein n=1 Tax=Pseudonocardia sp. GCM10023141 TaxID=3252653 RepID=UPI00361ED286